MHGILSTMVHDRIAMIRSTMVNDYSARLVQALGGSTPDLIKGLANHLGLTYNAVKKVVVGDSNSFNVVNHFKASRYLNVRPEWLGLNEEPMRDAESPSGLDRRTLELMIIAEHYDTAARDLMLHLVELVDQKEAELRQVAAPRAKAHTP